MIRRIPAIVMLLLTVFMGGFALPFLFSAANTGAVLLGFALLLGFIWLVWRWINYKIQEEHF